MSDLVERLRAAARRACTRHNGIDQFDLSWQRKPKDFIEWEAADEIKRLHKQFADLNAHYGGQADEIERLEADAENLRNTITSMQLSLKERGAEIKRLMRG